MRERHLPACWHLAAVATLAMTFGFAWFDVPGHCSAFAARDAALAASFLDGHTVYLCGMFATMVLTALAPRALERRAPAVVVGCLLLGIAANALYCMQVPIALTALAVGLMGFADVLLINVTAASSLALVSDRRAQATALVCALAAKTALVFTTDALLPDTGQIALFIAMPALGGFFSLVAIHLVDDETRSISSARLKFSPPLSTTMLGILVVAGFVFAATRVVSSMGFWGSEYAVSAMGGGACVLMTAVYLAVCYLTLVRTDSRLLFRFLPALLLLFALYATLYTGLGETLGTSLAAGALVSQYAELYGQAFVWTIVLLAVRTLNMPALRVMAVPFGLFVPVELALQRYLLASGTGSLAVVLFSFFAAFAALVWALCRFDGGADKRASGSCPAHGAAARSNASGEAAVGTRAGHSGCDAKAHIVESAGASKDAQPTGSASDEARRRIAAEAGLTRRETDVFLLLAQGRSRRFICDELFLADGTVSTYVSRVYDKLGVRTKQELLTYVLERESS